MSLNIKIKKSALAGRIAAPPSKSMAHRMLICAGLANGRSVIHGISDSEDMSATLSCLRALGVSCEKKGDTVTVDGIDIKKASANAPLNCNESASTLRFFIPLCLMSGADFELVGSKSLFTRPLSVYEKICKEQSFKFERNSESGIRVRGELYGREYKVDGNISSQFISGLLFALPLCEGDSTVSIAPPIESRSYLDLTIQALELFGIKIEWSDERTLYIKGGQRYSPREAKVEGDYSNAAFFSAMNLFDGNNVEIDGLLDTSLQGDRAYIKFFDMLCRGTPTIHIGNCPDLGPVLMAVAAAKNGAVLCGTHRLKIKESDRGAAMAEELAKFGVSVAVHDDSIVVYPTDFHAPSTVLSGHNDHRVVMSLSVLLALTGGEIEGAEAVNKSLPTFFDMMSSLGCEAEKV